MTVDTLEINKTFFSEKKKLNCYKMMFSKNDQKISDETTIADTVNKNFVNITKKFKIQTNRN